MQSAGKVADEFTALISLSFAPYQNSQCLMYPHLAQPWGNLLQLASTDGKGQVGGRFGQPLTQSLPLPPSSPPQIQVTLICLFMMLRCTVFADPEVWELPVLFAKTAQQNMVRCFFQSKATVVDLRRHQATSLMKPPRTYPFLKEKRHCRSDGSLNPHLHSNY